MRNIVVAGGDTRDIQLCQMLQNRGFAVRGWGIKHSGIPPYAPSDPAPEVLIGPMTGIDAEGRMTTLNGVAQVTRGLLDRMGARGLVAAGLIADTVLEWCAARGIRTVQYRHEASFMWLNAVPTAEGAMKAAIGLSGNTLFNRPLGILGFGRVGLILADRLSRYGSIVTIVERLPEKRAMAQAFGFQAYPLEALPHPPVDGIFNTIPAPVLDKTWFGEQAPYWVIDLASIPGGLDSALKNDSEVMSKYQHVLSIPGKVAPRRAAEIVWDTLSLLLEEEWNHEPIGERTDWRRNGGLSL